ncbi:hypothetical protein OSB04_003549 [Centaurea solstitialis]|uniref:mitogen-activated protein kinase kinase kinase n=1 Tax=Centaurea solstitialis TaxID=347529 RepID=A0AA38TV34_9ASTR|nr:hypothetical protein OSB04_003549 [Centaurea solstitialis]
MITNCSCRSHRLGRGMGTDGCGDLISHKPSTYHGRKASCRITLDGPPRIAVAPATTFTTLRPKIFSTVDVPQEPRLLPPSERVENKNNKVHPLPLPPGGVSRPVSWHQSLDKSQGKARKGQWEKGKLLGRGTYGSVYEATNCETGSLCALKEVDIIPDDTKSSECIRQLEQVILLNPLRSKSSTKFKTSKHCTVFGFRSAWLKMFLATEIMSSVQVEDKFCIYLEHVHPGSISKYVRERCGAVTESVVRNFTRHILSGLAYLHSEKTVHRDIKGANLLVDSSGVVKLADFGLAKHLSPYVVDLSLKGTPHWMAPEVLQAALRKDANSEHVYSVDIWSLGCTVIEMVTGKPPWSEFTAVQAMFNALNKSPPIPEALSLEGRDFLSRCLQRNPEKLSSAASLLEHPWCATFDHSFPLCKQEGSEIECKFQIGVSQNRTKSEKTSRNRNRKKPRKSKNQMVRKYHNPRRSLVHQPDGLNMDSSLMSKIFTSPPWKWFSNC